MGGIYLGEPQVADGGSVVAYPGDRHLILIGPNGSGKGTRLLAQNLVYGVDRSMVVIDPKGELAAMTIDYRRRCGEVVVLNPFGLLVDRLPHLKLESIGFNPLAALDPASATFPDDAMGMAEALVRVEGNEPHWSASAQDLVAALIMHVCREDGAKATLGKVRQLMNQPTLYKELKDDRRGDPVEGFRHTIALMATCNYPPLEAKAGRFFTESREVDSILSTATTQTRFLDSPPIADDLAKGGVDFAALKQRTVTVYLILPADRLRTHGNWLRLVIECALRALYTPRNHARPPVLFVLDEFAQLGNLPVIEDAMGLARGYGIQLWPVLQDLNQLHALYRDRWQSFIANAGALVAFAPRDFFTAKYLSDFAGQKTEWIETVNNSKTVSTNSESVSEAFNKAPTQMARYRPEELMSLPGGHLLAFLDGESGGRILKAPSHWLMPDVDSHLAPNPYHANL